MKNSMLRKRHVFVVGAGVDLYGNSQAWLFGANQIHNNGSTTDPTSAAIRVDGNSELFLRSGTIAHNIGPALLALVNSSVDFNGVTFARNTGRSSVVTTPQ